MLANTPKPPYYAVIFTSIRTDFNENYDEIANLMVDLASKQVGFLGIESARSTIGITVSYWSNLEAIREWKQHVDHQMAQKMGRDVWYQQYKTRIAKVERDYGFEK